jgi:peptide/nickel transport system ATP-binding protein
MNSAMSTQNSANARPVLLDVQNLSIDYVAKGAAPAEAVRDVSFTLRAGEVLGLVGESGCGKSTLMLGLMRLLPPAGRIVDGYVYFEERDLLSLSEAEMTDVRWKNISMIFQGAMNALNPVRTVGDQIAEAIRLHTTLSDNAAIDARVSQMLDMVGIAANRKDQYPHQYSGGMRQRAMIAMALACDPQIVIADEPTTALDVMIQAQILQLMADLQRELGLSIIFVTHDLGIVAEMCDSVLVMYGGVTAEYADVDTIYNAPRHPYTQELLKAFPDVTKPAGKLTSIPGYPPRLDDLPPGCRFAPRCPQAFARCHEAQPPLYFFEHGHAASCFLLEEGRA